MIHRETGEIEFGTGLRVGPSYSEAQFLSSPLARMSKALSQTQPWSGYRTARQRIHDRTFRVTLYFHTGKLAAVELFEVGAESKAFWNDWSSREEEERKASHDAWLQILLGAPPYEYPWGKVTSEFDPRGGYSSIVVRFGTWTTEAASGR
jgi:hypothetical protein